jgi:hypothetical protein
MKLFDFAYCPGFKDKINYLANICPEDWGKPDSYKNHPVLHNYIKHTFSKIYEDYDSASSEEKGIYIKIKDDNFLVFNTGLYDSNWQRVFAYFMPYSNSEDESKKWRLDSFSTEYQLSAMGIRELPKKAKNFNDINELVFNLDYEIVPQYNHIFDDENNNQRIPEIIRNSHMKRTLFDAAIELAKKRIDENYKVAVPQYYGNKIQLLLPMYLTNPIKPDLALTLTRDDEAKCYLGNTCITMEWAYNNARLIAKPNSDWLLPNT